MQIFPNKARFLIRLELPPQHVLLSSPCLAAWCYRLGDSAQHFGNMNLYSQHTPVGRGRLLAVNLTGYRFPTLALWLPRTTWLRLRLRLHASLVQWPLCDLLETERRKWRLLCHSLTMGHVKGLAPGVRRWPGARIPGLGVRAYSERFCTGFTYRRSTCLCPSPPPPYLRGQSSRH